MFETKYTIKLSKWSADSENLDRDYHKTWARCVYVAPVLVLFCSFLFFCFLLLFCCTKSSDTFLFFPSAVCQECLILLILVQQKVQI